MNGATGRRGLTRVRRTRRRDAWRATDTAAGDPPADVTDPGAQTRRGLRIALSGRGPTCRRRRNGSWPSAHSNRLGRSQCGLRLGQRSKESKDEVEFLGKVWRVI